MLSKSKDTHELQNERNRLKLGSLESTTDKNKKIKKRIVSFLALWKRGKTFDGFAWIFWFQQICWVDSTLKLV